MRKRGRKAVVKSQRRYTKDIHLLLTPEEYEQLFIIAEKGGYKSAAEFIRSKIREEYAKLVRGEEQRGAVRGRGGAEVEAMVETAVAVDGVAEIVNDDFIANNWISVIRGRGSDRGDAAPVQPAEEAQLLRGGARPPV
ncbi:MAG: hypothetical protein QXU60_06090 [Sulfolobales archaeon]